jgi:3-deoxy-D-manno-octulosonic-acid transferase
MKIAIGLSQELLKNGYKDILITSNTPSSKYYFDNSQLKGVEHCYLPLDYYLLTKNLVNKISAKLLIVIETEVWPNLYNSCKKNGTKILIINGRFNAPKGILGILSKNLYKNTLDNVEHVYTNQLKTKRTMRDFWMKLKLVI